MSINIKYICERGRKIFIVTISCLTITVGRLRTYMISRSWRQTADAANETVHSCAIIRNTIYIAIFAVKKRDIEKTPMPNKNL